MKIKGAFQTRDWLRLDTDAGKLISLTKRTILEIGVVGSLMADGRVPEFSAVCPREGGTGLEIEGGIIDPVALVLARRYWDAKNRPNFLAGTMEIPTELEARRILLEREGMAGWPRPAVEFKTQT